jgi:ankyrin repeat protein
MGGSNVDSVDIHGKTPLMKAVVNGHAALSEMLIKHGARLDLRDENELTVLHVCSQVAAKNNTFIPLLKLIIELMPPELIDSRDKDGRTPLMHAAILGDTDVSAIALLIKSGANILLADNYGLTAAELSKVTSTAIRQYFAIALSEKIEKDHHDWLAKTEIIDTSEKKKRKSKKNELKAEGDITETKNIESKIEL